MQIILEMRINHFTIYYLSQNNLYPHFIKLVNKGLAPIPYHK